MIIRDPLTIDGILFQREEHIHAGEQDAHDEIVVWELDVAGVEELGEEGARGFCVVCLWFFPLGWVSSSGGGGGGIGFMVKGKKKGNRL